jgi:fused signal recognition particle receptor
MEAEEIMESIISSLNNIYEANPELIFLAGSIAGLLLVTSIILLLSRGKSQEESGETSLEGSSAMESPPSQLGTGPEEQILDIQELKAEEGMSEELVEEAVSEEVELEEIAGMEEPDITEEEIRAKEDEELNVEPLEELEEEIEETREGLFSRLRAGLSRTQAGLIGKLDEMLSIRKEIDDNLWDAFEETLIMSDIGVGTTMKLRQEIEGRLTKKSLSDPIAVKTTLKDEILTTLKKAEGSPLSLDTKPFVLMVAGVNGVGKTTTIGKLAYRFRKDGKNVMVAAADTFRAAAVEQLEIWAKRVGSDFLKGQSGVDPSAVAFDAIKASHARGTDVLIIDTAGRLHTKTNLMDELKKIRRVIGRELPGAPHETLLVLDATTGQNAIQQAKMFKEAIEVTGIVLTKLDGTAKGGVIVAIADELNIPVKFIGIGEGLGDLREFKAEEFVEALFLTGKETLH